MRSWDPLRKFRTVDVPVAENEAATEERINDKEAAVANDIVQQPSSETDSEQISADAQAGVQAVEALTTVWTKNNLILAYVTYASILHIIVG